VVRPHVSTHTTAFGHLSNALFRSRFRPKATPHAPHPQDHVSPPIRHIILVILPPQHRHHLPPPVDSTHWYSLVRACHSGFMVRG
jgi:hypothetical protein